MKIEEFIKQMRQTMIELTIFHMECDMAGADDTTFIRIRNNV